MIKISILLLAVVGLSFAVDLDQEWSDWKTKYGKSYLSDIEEQWRREVWNRNYDTVVTHNTRGGSSYELEMNQFADLTSKEFNIIYNGYLNINDDSKTVHWYSPSSNGTLPDAVDWRDKGYVTEVKNQGKCGSCWAFSTTGSLEGQHFKATGKLVSLSEQNLVDCVKVDMGCRGGLMIDAFKYIEKNGGIDTEESYPYKAKNEKCHFKESDVGATMKSYVKIPKENCILLKDAVAKVGPISAAMDAGHNSFQLYKSGIYDPRICSKTKLDHGVLVVGYGSEGGTDYWIVKNSWGPHWGMEGYFKIEAKKDLCGICTSASYPVV